MTNEPKTTTDLNVKHFSRYGEFLVSFELSKHGWNVYNPMYDEYIDLLIHKYTCAKCGKNWNVTPSLKCSECDKDFSKTQKSRIIAKKICNKCKLNILVINQGVISVVLLDLRVSLIDLLVINVMERFRQRAMNVNVVLRNIKQSLEQYKLNLQEQNIKMENLKILMQWTINPEI